MEALPSSCKVQQQDKDRCMAKRKYERLPDNL